MCLLDTTDGALMMALYTSTSLAKDQIAILYYSIVLTVITVIVAMVIGFIQLLSLILNVASPTGKFWVCDLSLLLQRQFLPITMHEGWSRCCR
jgi:high-affinity nickel-transport protein